MATYVVFGTATVFPMAPVKGIVGRRAPIGGVVEREKLRVIHDFMFGGRRQYGRGKCRGQGNRRYASERRYGHGRKFQSVDAS